jgi:hypothetical protein
MLVPNGHEPDLWWEIDCDYEGKHKWGVAFGDTVEQAEANFKNSLPCPEHAVNVLVKPVLENTGVEAMADMFN